MLWPWDHLEGVSGPIDQGLMPMVDTKWLHADIGRYIRREVASLEIPLDLSMETCE
jgi:hypothetical protein